eukprot:COSAG02_NODE_8393_length_2587_cov_1.414791_1_plen_53_part_00
MLVLQACWWRSPGGFCSAVGAVGGVLKREGEGNSFRKAAKGSLVPSRRSGGE